MMSRAAAGVAFLVCASELLGLLLGQWFYGLFLKTVPPLAMSSFNMGAAHAAFLLYGLLAGLAISALGLSAVALSRFFRSPGRES